VAGGAAGRVGSDYGLIYNVHGLPYPLWGEHREQRTAASPRTGRALRPQSPPQDGRARQQAAVRRQIDTTDRQIDRLVYELYGLADEEIRIVEEAPGGRL